MIETRNHGAMAMVKIDGAKVRKLREQKGLTQLYVATAVQVTTDTISRWENKRYPTIKKENGRKLAESLEVSLDEILLQEEGDKDNVINNIRTSQLADTVTGGKNSFLQKKQVVLIAVLFVLAVLTIVVSITLWPFKSISPSTGATRYLPQRCTSGIPFPVVIEVSTNSEKPLAVIVKESLPDNISIIKTVPSLPPAGKKDQTLKWLSKVQQKAVFGYIAVFNTSAKTPETFSGTIAGSNKSSQPISIKGNDTIIPGNNHWADLDGDYKISDEEILTVYDHYGELDNFGISTEVLESIWLGSGYRWDIAEKKYIVLP